MTCPVCGEGLREIDWYGVMVDLCPRCKGVWLDRGELEKLLAMGQQPTQESHQYDSSLAAPPPPPVAPTPSSPELDRGSDPLAPGSDDDYRRPHGHRRSRRDSWFESIVEIFDD